MKKSSDVSDDDIRLTSLKNEITEADLYHKFYTNPEELAEIIFNDLKNRIEEDFPLQSVPSPLEKERQSHVAFQDTRSKVYIGFDYFVFFINSITGRQTYFDTIDRCVGSRKSVPIVVLGQSGLGKV